MDLAVLQKINATYTAKVHEINSKYYQSKAPRFNDNSRNLLSNLYWLTPSVMESDKEGKKKYFLTFCCLDTYLQMIEKDPNFRDEQAMSVQIAHQPYRNQWNY